MPVNSWSNAKLRGEHENLEWMQSVVIFEDRDAVRSVVFDNGRRFGRLDVPRRQEASRNDSGRRIVAHKLAQ